MLVFYSPFVFCRAPIVPGGLALLCAKAAHFQACVSCSTLKLLHSVVESNMLLELKHVLKLFSSFCFCFGSWPAMCIHGDKSQPERDWVLNGKSERELVWPNNVLFFFINDVIRK